MNSACSLRGFHGIIALVPDVQQKDSLKLLHTLLTKLLNALNSSQLGLTSTAIALVADKAAQSAYHPLGKEWLTLSEVTAPATSQLHPRGKRRRSAEKVGGVHVHTLEPLQRAVQTLEGVMDKNSVEREAQGQSCHLWSAMATQLHYLLDNTPWKIQDHSELSFYWVVSESEDIPPPDTAIAFYSALERLQVWHRSHVTITCDSPAVESKMHLWTSVLKVPCMVLTNSWSPPVGMFWRGAIHFTEHKNYHDAYLNNTAVFQGFALSLTAVMNISSVTMVMEGVGLDPQSPFLPTHLEVVQILDVSTVPHILLSPLRCTLSLVNPQHVNSAQLFHQWFTRRPSQPNSVGFLMRLCLVERKEGTRIMTSADWTSHIQTRDLPTTATAIPSALDCYQPGPIILVCPRDSPDTLSCDCWFLWQHKALHMHLLKDPCPVVSVMRNVDRNVSIHDVCSHLPLLRTKSSSTSPERSEDFVNIDSTQFWRAISETKCEVDTSPSQWPEMQAMKRHERIQRKLAHKSKTPELLFGQPLPPPQSTTPESSLCVGNVLECFADDGSPLAPELSPVALQDPANTVKIMDPNGMDISFESIAGTTPTSKKLIHGIQYCLTADDLAMDAKLQRLQQCCLASERSSHCFNSNTPQPRRRHHYLCNVESGSTTADAGPSGREHLGSPAGSNRDNSTINPDHSRTSHPAQDCEGSISRPVPAPSSTKYGVLPPSRRGIKRKLDLISQGAPQKGVELRGGAEGVSASGGGSQTGVIHEPQVITTLRQTVKCSEASGLLDVNKMRTREEVGTTGGQVCALPSTRAEDGITDTTRGLEKENIKESRKKLLEKTIVTVLKTRISREHPCFRMCYNRLFNLCKTFLKDVRNPELFANEMEHTVNFNVKQVIEFELRQAGLNL